MTEMQKELLEHLKKNGCVEKNQTELIPLYGDALAQSVWFLLCKVEDLQDEIKELKQNV